MMRDNRMTFVVDRALSMSRQRETLLAFRNIERRSKIPRNFEIDKVILREITEAIRRSLKM